MLKTSSSVRGRTPSSSPRKTAHTKPFSRSSQGSSSAPSHGPRKSFSSSSSHASSSRSVAIRRPTNRFKSNGRNSPSRTGRRGGTTERIDHSRFINKAAPITESKPYVPTHTFSDFAIDERLKKAIANKNYITPSPIQDQAIPHALLGHDVLGIANTGTGKTAAFLIPLIHKMLTVRDQKVLIVAPTRELAIQIDKELQEFVRGMKIFSVVVVGGAPVRPQISEIRRGVDFIIGTPGRLLDLIKHNDIVLSEFQNIVLDEADRMLDMGFIDDIRTMLAGISPESQKLFFTATLAPEIERLVNQFLKDPIKVMVKTRDTSKNVDQDIIRVARGEEKIEILDELLKRDDFQKVLIFAETKIGVERLTKDLMRRGFAAGSIHGDKRHRERVRTLNQFKADEIKVLVATDVAARGLDIPDVTHVINYEMPQTYDTYVHRIGRTGRANKTGTALTFVHA